MSIIYAQSPKYCTPDDRLKLCTMCGGNGWVPDLLGINTPDGSPIIARELCAACHGEGWRLR